MISISLLFPFFFQNHQSSSSTKPTKKSRATSVHAPSNDSLQPQPSTVTIQQPTHHGNRLINMTQQNDSASYVKSSYRKSSARTREYGPPVMPQKEKRQPIPSSSSSNLPSTSSSMAVSGAARLGSSHSVLTNEDELEPQQSRLTKIKVNRLFQIPEKKICADATSSCPPAALSPVSYLQDQNSQAEALCFILKRIPFLLI